MTSPRNVRTDRLKISLIVLLTVVLCLVILALLGFAVLGVWLIVAGVAIGESSQISVTTDEFKLSINTAIPGLIVFVVSILALLGVISLLIQSVLKPIIKEPSKL